MLAPSHKLIVWSLTQWLIYTTAIVVQSLSLVRLCNPLDWNTPGFPDLHCLPEFAQTHVHWGADAIHPSHPLIVGELQIQKKKKKMVLSCQQCAQAPPHLILRVLTYQLLLLLNRQQAPIWPLLCLKAWDSFCREFNSATKTPPARCGIAPKMVSREAETQMHDHFMPRSLKEQP